MSDLLSALVGSEAAPVVVLFGGNPVRRDEVLRSLKQLGDVTVYGALSEEEGLDLLRSLGSRVVVVLIGGRYTSIQRSRIAAWVSAELPSVQLSEPGVTYPYSTAEILADVRRKISGDAPPPTH